MDEFRFDVCGVVLCVWVVVMFAFRAWVLFVCVYVDCVVLLCSCSHASFSLTSCSFFLPLLTTFS